jgi:hypothetical protein
MTVFAFVQDSNGKNSFLLRQSDFKRTTTLAADVEQTLAAPSTNTNGYVAIFGYEIGKTVYVGFGSTAVTLPGASFADTNGQINLPGTFVAAGETMRFRSAAAATVGVVLYEVL